MVEKKVYDSILVRALARSELFDSLALLDREGLPISFIAKTQEDKIPAQSYAAISHALFTRVFNFATATGLSLPVLSLHFTESKILFQIPLQHGFVVGVIDKLRWPFNSDNFQLLLSDAEKNLSQLKKQKVSMLQGLYVEGQTHSEQVAIKGKYDPNLTIKCIDQISKGIFSPQQWAVNASGKDLFIQLNQNIQNFAINTAFLTIGEEILSGAGALAEPLGNATKKTIKVFDSDLNANKFGNLLCSVGCYQKGELVIEGVIGELDGKRVDMVLQLPGWQDGIVNGLSLLYSAAVIQAQQSSSSIPAQLITLLKVMMSGVDELRPQIEAFLNQNNITQAVQLMERSAQLLLNQGQYSIAADYYKWIAFTYYQQADYQKAQKYYESAVKYYENAGDMQNLVETMTDLASLYEMKKDSLNALLTFNKVREIYINAGAADQVQPIEQKMDELQGIVQQDIKNYLSTIAQESIPFTTIAQHFNVDVDIMEQVISELVQNQIIPGFINSITKSYSKSSMASASSGTATMPNRSNYQGSNFAQANQNSSANLYQSNGMKTGQIGQAGQVMFIDYTNAFDEVNKLKTQNIKLDQSLSQMEQQFQMKGLKIMDFLKYQARLGKKTLNDLKIKIYTEMPQFNAQDGTPITCPICLDSLDGADLIVADEHGHGFHGKCLAQWIKTQDRCPLCNSRLLPFVFKDYRVGGAPVSNANSKKIQELEQQIQILKQSIGGNLDLFEKLVAERETKDRLMQELRRKEQMINELRSMVKTLHR